MTDLKILIENAVQRTVGEPTFIDEFTVRRYRVESPSQGAAWMVYEFPDYIACVPEGGLLTSPATRCYDKPESGD